ncbi:hypothetical protein QWA68_014969 [Fusarium oxysporum]|nr:hypothetical protein QWA68_014969 [Fusarium oxysporum]
MQQHDTLGQIISRPVMGACDACKRRKVKCDNANPCANCSISQISCEHRIAPRKRGRPPKGSLRQLSQEETCESIENATADMIDDSPVNSLFEQDAASDPQATSVLEALATPFSPGTLTTPPSVSTVLRETLGKGSLAAFAAVSRNQFVPNVAHIFQKLAAAVNHQLADEGETIATCAHKCVDIFMQYLFPNTPIAHEPTLRSAAALFDLDGDFLSPEDDETPSIERLRALTLITALCALVNSAMSQGLFSTSKSLTWLFYNASRATLRLYEEYDLEFPHSTSYHIRMWQSAALQNSTGRDRASWHIHGESILLAVRARLYDEDTISRLPQLEAQLLRVNFWLMYLADKTAAAFEARPSMIPNDYLAEKLTLREQGGQDSLQLDLSRPCNGHSLERRLLTGFHLKRRLWAAAADMICELRLFPTRNQVFLANTEVDRPDISGLVERYLNFVGHVDHLPEWLQSPQRALEGVEAHVAEYQAASFWAQRSNIMSVYHCMKLVILQKCIEMAVPEVVGLNQDPIFWAMQKLETSRDFIREVQMVPFVCFKVQGEPAVERVRRVGSILLAVVNDAPTTTIEIRARSLFEQLLDILANLDSKASDNLEVLSYFVDMCQ